MHTKSDHALSRWTLRLDGAFLAIAGSVALIADTMGHFFGIVTTALHIIFVGAQGVCLWREMRATTRGLSTAKVSKDQR